MADDSWGNPGGASAKVDDQPAADTWGTSALEDALPTNGEANGHDESAAGEEATEILVVEQKEPPQLEGWVKPALYDYNSAEPDTWDGNARIYEWDGETGDVGPEFPELEIQLFGEPDKRDNTGIDFTTIANLELFQEGPVRIEPIKQFEDAGLHPVMLKNVEMCGYKVPTPIQRYCLPAITMGHDVIAIAQTGSGKTAAFMIPILNKLMGKAKKLAAPRPNPATYRPGIDPPCRAEPLVVVVCPSRELAIQIFNEARKLCYRSMLRPCVIYGGGPIREQVAQLQKGCDILVASPGRLIDFMDRPDILTLRRVRYMVIDEADEMLHDDWKEEFDKILSGGEQEEGNIKYMLFSATFPKATRDLAKTHLAESHVRLRVGRAGSSHENIKQQIVMVDPSRKREALYDLLCSLPPTRTMVFVNSRRTADELDDFLFNKGIPCTAMHADRTQKEREAAMRAFKSGQSPVLVATGVSARGIDVRNVMHVINYDLPSLDYGGIEEYTHRIGRTGRIGHRGLATSFYTERDEPIASVLTRTLLETKQEIPDFLQEFVPEGEAREKLKFEADSDFEDNDGEADDNTEEGAGAWGAKADANEDAADAWGDKADADEGAAGAWGGNSDAGTWGADTSASKEANSSSGW